MGIELVTKRIVLDDQYLDKNIHFHLFNKVKELAKNDCSKEYGYIIDVKRIKKILDLLHFLKRIGVFDALHIFVLVLSEPVLRRYGTISFHHSFQHTLFDEFHQFGVSVKFS